MSDLLDQDQKHQENEINFNPSSNPSQSDYDKKFAQQSNPDGFVYSPDPDRQDLALKEGVADGLYKPSKESDAIHETAGEQGAVARILGSGKSRLQGLASGSKKKKIAIAASGLGLVIIPLILFLIFMLIAGFGLRQYAVVLRNGMFGAMHLNNIRRTGQILDEAAYNAKLVQGAGHLDMPKGSIYERLRGFKPDKVLGNLGEEGKLKFNFSTGEDATKLDRVRELLKPSSTAELKGVTIGDRTILVEPEKKGLRLNYIDNIRQQSAHVKAVEDALRQSDLFGEEGGRFVRSAVAKRIFDAEGIKLYRWVRYGSKIRNFEEAMLDMWKRTKPSDSRSSSLASVEDAKGDIDEAIEKALKEGGDDLTEEITKEALNKSTNGALKTARSISGLAFAATVYCSALDYNKSKEEQPKRDTAQLMRKGALLQSASDQYTAGYDYGVNSTNVMAEAKSYTGFNNTMAYQALTGGDTSGMEPDIAEHETPFPKNGGALDVAMKTIQKAGDIAIGGMTYGGWQVLDATPWGSKLKSGTCNKITSTGGQLTLVGIETIANIASLGSEGAATEGVMQALKQGVPKLLVTTEGRKVAAGAALDATLILSTDKIMEWVLGKSTGIDNSGLANGTDNAKKSALGTQLLANEQARAYGGRPLTATETAEIQQNLRQTRMADLRNTSLSNRFLSLSNPYSPSSLFTASLPIDQKSMHKSVASYFNNRIMNPIAMFTQPAAQFAAASLKNHSVDNVVYANGAVGLYSNIDVPTWGFSLDENNKMLDSSYWPTNNEDRIAPIAKQLAEKYDKCFDDKITDLIKDNGDNMYSGGCSAAKLSSDEAFRYRLYRMDHQITDELTDLQTVTQSASTQNTPSNKNIYILGDSYTVGMKTAGLESKLKAAGFTPTIEASCGRPLAAAGSAVRCGGGSAGFGGLTEVDQPSSQSAIKSAGTVIIALGTNDAHGGSPDTFAQNVSTMIDKIKAQNSSAQIKWVNLYDPQDAANTLAFNEKLNQLSSSKGFSIIDWATPGKQATFGDNLHPSDFNPLVNLILQSLGAQISYKNNQSRAFAYNKTLIQTNIKSFSLTKNFNINLYEGIG